MSARDSPFLSASVKASQSISTKLKIMKLPVSFNVLACNRWTRGQKRDRKCYYVSLYATLAKSGIGPTPQPVTKNSEVEQNTGCLRHV